MSLPTPVNNCRTLKTRRPLLLAVVLVLLPVSLFGQQNGYAHSAGVDIHYKVYGEEGEPLLVINGGPGFSSEGFSGLAEKLAGHYRVILYDQRGTGKSVMASVNSGNITMELMAMDIEKLRKHLGLERWTILGHSFGGVMANYYTARHPDRVKGIIASSSGGLNLELLENFDIRQQLSPMEVDSLAYWTARIAGGDTTGYADRKRREFLASAYLYDDRHIPVIAERLGEGNLFINGLIWSDLQSMEFDVTEELAGFTGPVLVIQGRQDVIPEEIGNRALEVFPDAELIILEKCGHYGWVEQPERYFKEIFSFRDRISPS